MNNRHTILRLELLGTLLPTGFMFSVSLATNSLETLSGT